MHRNRYQLQLDEQEQQQARNQDSCRKIACSWLKKQLPTFLLLVIVLAGGIFTVREQLAGISDRMSAVQDRISASETDFETRQAATVERMERLEKELSTQVAAVRVTLSSVQTEVRAVELETQARIRLLNRTALELSHTVRAVAEEVALLNVSALDSMIQRLDREALALRFLMQQTARDLLEFRAEMADAMQVLSSVNDTGKSLLPYSNRGSFPCFSSQRPLGALWPSAGFLNLTTGCRQMVACCRSPTTRACLP